ncbi:hypothetical protein QBC33DRAFT_559469 [Phialemonium atrogriseum]|uniref:Myb-like domain-containing protein n=1 Tax=Phialemonium atrogriseum TaxID=1093897 RepID=A0AAJ0FLJ3_9PEZI|nr:uncharacterized protein QBC33DRAFT_559469 [Phialemonium atrogriseum]KAK1766739.1 hypothetical protein QBC33DRAFT_559469 [Phialemonium atrogriseum]
MDSDGSSNGPDEGDEPILSGGQADDSQAGESADSDEYGLPEYDERRRREVDSDDSIYEPEPTDEEDEDGNPLSDLEPEPGVGLPFRSVKPEAGEDPISLARIPASSPPWHPFKRPADSSAIDLRPFKRTRGDFNRGYLDLLNIDIEDAAAHYVPHDGPELPSSQIGLTIWTPLEKEMFFEALSRLGRDGVPGISRRIGSKSDLEVQQYLRVLDDAIAARKQSGNLEPSYPVDFPAAVEISPKCCKLLEGAADVISLRQEQHEEAREEERWGKGWLVTPFNYRDIEATRSAGMPSVQLFRVASWLRLSERVFMNASYPENNWQHVSEDNPSIRATALEDFYSLAVSITRRLVSATIYVSTSRIRAKQSVYPETRGLVWPKDVEAAALSIGLKTNSKKFWAGCARRLRLAVFDDDDDDDADDDVEAEHGDKARGILSFDEVEAALGGHDSMPEAEPVDEESDELMSLSETPSLDDLSDLEAEEDAGPAVTPDIELPDEQYAEVDEDEVRAESRELLLHTAFDHPRTTRTREALESRIAAELRHVAHADTMDARATYLEEKRLWNVLGRAAPDELVRVEQPAAPPRLSHTVNDLCPAGEDGRTGGRG